MDRYIYHNIPHIITERNSNLSFQSAPPDPNMIFPRDGISFFGVFDGHGGSEAGPCC